MLLILMEHKIIIGLILILFIISIGIQIAIGIFFTGLIRETENMASTDRALLCQCKRKFASYYELNAGVLNVSVFADKYLNKIRIGRMSATGLKHLSGQLMLLSVFVCGLGACLGIIRGETVGNILPYYIISLFGLYIYFSVSAFVDMTGKRRILKTNMVDYLENNMVSKMTVLEEDLKIVAGKLAPEQEKVFTSPKESLKEAKRSIVEYEEPDREEKKPEKHKSRFGKSEEKELEELLKEFLT